MAELKQLLGSTVADEIMISSGAGPYTHTYDISVLRETEFAIYFDSLPGRLLRGGTAAGNPSASAARLDRTARQELRTNGG
jgi:hypothetical protein